MESVLCLTRPCVDGALTTLDLVRLAVATFLAILFLQSSIDKIVDRKGNLGWMTPYFAKSPLAPLVAPMLSVITLIELAAGTLSALGVLMLIFTGSRTLAALGALLAVAGMLMLFFGMRVAKDYAGAAGFVPYFILACAGLALMGMP